MAAVAAVDEDTALAACELIEVEYEALETIGNVEEAVAKPTPQLHDYADSGNLHKLVNLQFGDLDAGFARADLVREDLFFYEGNTHLPMEQHAAVGHWQPNGRVTVWTSTQTPHYVHRAMSKVLGLPPSQVRIIATPNGGGFGGKSDPFGHEIVVAKLSQLTGRPVKIGLTREEVFYCHRGRHQVLMKVKTGVTKDGAITAMDFESYLDGGAYGSYGVASTYYTGALQTVTYDVPTYRFRGARAFTNKPPCGPKRGHGTPQPRFGVEVQLDKLAEELGLDPAEMRLRHLVKPDSVTANWLKIGSMGLGPCIEKVVEGSGWKERFRKLPYGQGLGIACSSYITGAGLPIYWNDMPHSGVQIKVDRGGGVTVFCGSTDIGQGSDSILAYITAEVLGIDPKHIAIVTSDTDLTPVDLGSYSSRVTLMTGQACIQAAERIRARLARASAAKLDVPADRLTFGEDRVFDTRDPERGMTFTEAVVLAETEEGTVGAVGQLQAAPLAGPLPGRRGRAVGGLQLFGGGGRGGGGPGDRNRAGAEDLDRARYRPVHQPGPGDGAGGRRGVHGARRGADGGDGLPREPERGAQVAVDAGVQEPDHVGDVRRDHVSDRRPGRERALRRQGGGAGAAAAGDAGGGERDLRRGGRQSGRGADVAAQGTEGDPGEGEGAGPALRADQGAGRAVAGGDLRADPRRGRGW